MIKTGELITTDGYYKYKGHVSENNPDCFIPSQSYKMLFRKRQKAPKLGSCPHDVVWELIEVVD